MAKQPTTAKPKERAARQRDNVADQGAQRVEVTVPKDDAKIIKAVAGILWKGGKSAKRLRKTIVAMASMKPAQTGEELLAFFHASPLAGEDLVFERDKSTGRPIDLG